ncbi:MAG: hypothetical protein EPO24_13455 [Bacteroidetes bacterium]|nr:MAG: hypothetical protein EPO24_13455 [Bacteroidota bacterium]
MLLLKSIIIVIVFISAGTAQTSSLFNPSDARSVAMGESFVAVNDPLSSFIYNPASYNANSGFSVRYSARRANFSQYDEEHTYYNASMSYNSPIGEFGLLYNRYDEGEYIAWWGEPRRYSTIHRYDHVLLAKYSNHLGDHVSLGASCKIYNIVEAHLDGAPYPVSETTTLPFLFDLGTMFSTANLSTNESATHGLTFGASLQNYGTDLRYRSGFDGKEYFIKLPRYLRMGLSYAITTLPNDADAPSLFKALLSAESKFQVNSSSSQSVFFWGLGAEITIYELLSLRVGGKTNPYSSPYGEEDALRVRYGAGINFPLNYLSFDTPLRLTFDYAGIPIETPSPYWYSPVKTSVLQVFSLGLEYPTTLSE